MRNRASIPFLFAILCGLPPAARAGSALDSLPRSTPQDSLTGARHHALELPLTGFYAVIPPRNYDPSGRKKYPLCVILHGSGSSEVGHGVNVSGLLGLDDILYLSPRAPYPHYGVFMGNQTAGWTAWPEFPEAWGRPDGPDFPAGEVRDLDPVRQYADWIARCIRDAQKRYPVQDGKVVVVGHSQGAAFAQYFTALHPDLVKAYAAYAGYYKRSLESDSAALVLKRAGIRPYILHCEADSVVKVQGGRDLTAYLEKHGVPHDKSFYPGGDHTLGSRPIADIRTFVATWCLGKPAPPRKGKLLVHGLERRSSADSAGLRIGDWLKDYDGKPLRTRDDFLSAVEAAQGKPEVKLTVESEGKARVVKLRSGKPGVWLTER